MSQLENNSQVSDISLPSSKRRRYSDGTDDIEAGIIEKIELKNFMCHSNLELALGPRINFIVGVNGSGKSASLVALSTCLGARTSFTQRGSRISDYIKVGKNTAVIRITLNNRGEGSYKPEIFGKSIIVERRITKDGSSGYKIKDHAGKTISTLRSELNYMLEQFDIQVDNPCNILMQETSKQFLNSNRPERKYQLFLNATQLEQLKKDLENSIEMIKEMTATIEAKQKALAPMKEKALEYEREYKELSRMEETKKKVRELKDLLAWSYIAESEREYKIVNKKLEDIERNTVKYTEILETKTNHLEKIKKDIVQKKLETDSFTIKNSDFERERSSIIQQMNDTKRNYERIYREINNVKDEISTLNRRTDMAKKLINDRNQRDNIDEEREKQEREIERNKKQNQIKDLESTIEEISKEELTIEKKEEELKLSEKAHLDIQKELQIEQSKIDRLQRAKENKHTLFGPKVPTYLKLIEDNASKFKKKPIGPVGMYITLKDETWATAVEVACKSKLGTFIVDNHDDFKLFTILTKSKGVSPPDIVTIKMRDEKYNVKINNSYNTFLEVMEINNPNCFNVLCDWCGIDKKAIVKTTTEAYEILSPSCNEIITQSGERVFLMGGVEGWRPSDVKNPRIGIDIDKEIKRREMIKQEINTRLEEEKEKNQQNRTLKDDLARKKRDLSSKRNNINKDIYKLKQESQDLMKVRKEKAHDESIQELEQSIRENLDMIEVKKQQIATNNKNLEIVKTSLKEHELKANDIQKLCDKNTTEIDSIMRDIRNLTNEVQSLSNEIPSIEMNLNKWKELKVTLENKKNDLEEKIKEDSLKASQLSGRPDVEIKESPDDIIKKIERYEKQISEKQRGRRSIEEVIKSYSLSKNTYEKLKNIINDLKVFSEKLKLNVKIRHKKWKKFLVSISHRTKMLFAGYLSQKGFSGSLEFDHEQEKLTIHVNPSNSHNQKGRKDTSTLSGGERSFSTVCLLLALWDTMESPFRAMDEFDVYMDAVNRRISTELLIKSARDKGNRQYIFLTPHDLGSIHLREDIKITKMYPPERNQRVDSE